MKLLSVSLLAFLVGGFSASVSASCTGSDRISHRDAACLQAKWRNNYHADSTHYSRYWVQNTCPEFGTVVVKVNVQNAPDRTLHLNDGKVRTDDLNHPIHWISCCRDLSAACSYPEGFNPP